MPASNWRPWHICDKSSRGSMGGKPLAGARGSRVSGRADQFAHGRIARRVCCTLFARVFGWCAHGDQAVPVPQ
jgi:hypothetical protein